MIIQLQENIKEDHKTNILNKVNNIGYKTTEVKTQVGNYLVCIGKKDFDIRGIGSLEGVSDIHRVSDSYKLVSRKWKVGRTALELSNGVQIGGNEFSIMLGPCSIESEEQVYSVIEYLKNAGVKVMRGGVYKPRSSPYSFRGMGMDGLKMWHKAAKEAGIAIITEVMQVSQIEPMYDYIDIFQVGARNSQNFNLLDELGKVDKPVLLKRAMSGTIDELLHSAEYIFSQGNEKLMLCERGIRTYENAYRNTFDINAIPVLKDKSHLPVIADPSHGIGVRKYVLPIALASLAAGADGAIMEIHPEPAKAASDGQQTLDYRETDEMLKKIRMMASDSYL